MPGQPDLPGTDHRPLLSRQPACRHGDEGLAQATPNVSAGIGNLDADRLLRPPNPWRSFEHGGVTADGMTRSTCQHPQQPGSRTWETHLPLASWRYELRRPIAAAGTEFAFLSDGGAFGRGRGSPLPPWAVPKACRPDLAGGRHTPCPPGADMNIAKDGRLLYASLPAAATATCWSATRVADDVL